MKLFKIQHPNGLFSKGGKSGWSKRGKVWTMRGHVHNHMKHREQMVLDYSGCILIEYDVNDDGSSSVVTKTPMEDVVILAAENSRKRNETRTLKVLTRQRDSLKSQLDILNTKLDDESYRSMRNTNNMLTKIDGILNEMLNGEII